MSRATEQARYIEEMVHRLADRIEEHERCAAWDDSNLGERFVMACQGEAPIASAVWQLRASENIDRMITQIRLELLELRRLAV